MPKCSITACKRCLSTESYAFYMSNYKRYIAYFFDRVDSIAHWIAHNAVLTLRDGQKPC